MRRIPALLIGAGLAISSTTALADDPSRTPSSPSDPTLQQHRQQARLGVMVLSLTPELRTHFGAKDDRGVMVARVEQRSPAANAGITVGDVIVEVHTVDDAEDVLSALASVKQGDSVPVKIVRDHRPMTLQVKLTGTQTSFLDAPLRDWLRTFPFGNSAG